MKSTNLRLSGQRKIDRAYSYDQIVGLPTEQQKFILEK